MTKQQQVEREARNLGKMVWPFVHWDCMTAGERQRLDRLARNVLLRVEKARLEEKAVTLYVLAHGKMPEEDP